MIYLAPFILIAPLFLLFFGGRISNRIRARQALDPNAWIGDRVRIERNPARRTAWRMIRNDELEAVNQPSFEPVPDEFLADMIRLGVALGEIDQADADALLAPPVESTVKQGEEEGVTLTDLLPVRLALFDRNPRQPKHSAPAEVDRLRRKLVWADLLIKTQRVQIDDTTAKQAAAEELVVQQQADIDELMEERDELRAEVLRFRARFGPQLAAEANAARITVPPMVRDTTAVEDQATGPIDVRPLWDALGVGPVTDPGRIH